MVKKIKDVLKYGRELLNENGIDSRETRLLLALSMEVGVSELIKHDFCTEEQYDLFKDYLNRRISGEPYSYIAGYKEFMKLNFFVNKNVLIPREDTEILVLEAIKQDKKRILDMCTGSGCIAVSLAKYIENSSVDAADISTSALEVARKNAETNGVKVNFIESNLFDNISETYDMIVSNPPYIKTADMKTLQKEVKFEPQNALDGGTTGLDFYIKIANEAVKYLNDDGVLLFEIGFDEATDVGKILKENNFCDIKVIKDLSENDRVVYAKKG